MKTVPKRTILGIDPGFDRIGWGVGSVVHGKITVLDKGCITTNRSKELSIRYQSIHHELQQILTLHNPTELAIESLFFGKNTTTALKVSEARGVILLTCLQANLSIAQYAPSQMKLAVTGHGKANKKAVEKMVRLQLSLGTDALLDDTIDALGLIITHCALMRSAYIA